MKSIKAGAKIVVGAVRTAEDWSMQLRTRVVRARVLRGGRGCIRFRIESDDLVQLGSKPRRLAAASIRAEFEGTDWARGWDGDAAEALRALAALS